MIVLNNLHSSYNNYTLELTIDEDSDDESILICTINDMKTKILDFKLYPINIDEIISYLKFQKKTAKKYSKK